MGKYSSGSEESRVRLHNTFPILFKFILNILSSSSSRGGSRKLFWEGHIELKSPKTTKRDAEGVEGEMYEQEVYPLLSRLSALGERRKLPQPL